MMAAMSVAHTSSTTTLTPPSSSHGDTNEILDFQWDFTSVVKPENHHYEAKPSSLKYDNSFSPCKESTVAHDGNIASNHGHDPIKLAHGDDVMADRSGAGALSRSYSNEETPDTMADGEVDDDEDKRNGSPAALSHKRSKEIGGDTSDEESKWIHRDKLAKIESEELQAAGIILPRPRSRSRPCRERSQSNHKQLAGDTTESTRSRLDSSAALDSKTPDTSAAINGWAGEDDLPARPTTGSRIPVPKKSPMLGGVVRSRENSPEDLEKRLDVAPKARSRSNSTTLKSLEPSLTLKNTLSRRSYTDASTGKKTVTPTASGVRKVSAPSKSIPPEARGKVKSRGKGSISGNNGRPGTRSSERELSTCSISSKPMEGEPPWMVSAYKPDPRLPPDQQLLPTVAKRLAQEKWESEGKFGNVYDKNFRPLNEDGFLSQSENVTAASSSSPSEVQQNEVVKQEVERPDEWPLKSPEPKSPGSAGRSSTYSTMPRIPDNPPAQPPMASPRIPSAPSMVPPPQPVHITRVPVSEKVNSVKRSKKTDGGCGCCIVM